MFVVRIFFSFIKIIITLDLPLVFPLFGEPLWSWPLSTHWPRGHHLTPGEFFPILYSSLYNWNQWMTPCTVNWHLLHWKVSLLIGRIGIFIIYCRVPVNSPTKWAYQTNQHLSSLGGLLLSQESLKWTCITSLYTTNHNTKGYHYLGHQGS